MHKYEAIGYFPFNHRNFFDSDEEVVEYYWTYFYYGEDYYNKIRILDCYTRQPIDMGYFLNIYHRMRAAKFERVWKNRYGNYKFRCGPVPGIRNWRGGKAAKAPRRMNEIRQGVSRAKRQDWIDWDWYTYRKTEKNWKSQRKTQWKTD